ncbi:MAG: hypothetical protein ACRCXN_03715 [Bacteroidales bacterium]
MNSRCLPIPLIIFLCLLFNERSIAQEQGFVFPMGCRVVIQLDTTTVTSNPDYSVLYYEDFTEIVDTYDNISHFFIDQPKNTVQFIFTVSTHGKTKTEVERNYRSILLIRSRYPYELSYHAAISSPKTAELNPTKVLTLLPNIKNTELWQYFTDSIAIYDFGKILRTDMEQQKIRIKKIE